MEAWVRRSSAFTSTGEASEYFVMGAFTKFWRAITPDRFASFPTLVALLNYLRLCATSVVIDRVRTQSGSEMLPEEPTTGGTLKQGVKAGTIVQWLKEYFNLGHGHAMAIVALLKGAKSEDSE